MGNKCRVWAAGDPRNFDPQFRATHGDNHSEFRVIREDTPPAPPAPPPTAAASDYHETKAVADRWNAHIDALDADASKLTPEGRRERLAAFDKSQLDTIPQRHDQRLQQAEQQIQQMLDGQHPDSNSVAEQIHAQRVWARNNIADVPVGQVAATVQKLIDSATPAELKVYHDELPKALEAKGLPADLVKPLLASRMRELGEAIATRDAEQQVSLITRHNVGVVRRAIDAGHKVAVPLVDPTSYDPERSRPVTL